LFERKTQMGSKAIFILGAGGHAAVIIQAIRLMGGVPSGCYDDNSALRDVLGVPVLGTIKELSCDSNKPAVIALGSNAIRRDLALRFPNAQWQTVIHPAAVVDSTATIGNGVVILAGAIVQARAQVGSHAIVNARSLVDHDCSIGNFAHIAQGVVLGGGVQVGDGTLVGIGSVMESGSSVGAWKTIPPGSTVLRNQQDA
jgi:acetyltransferase EpsM